ncbi:MAG: hypothetical protein P0120_10825 [Nitrospira sp.]|nr:hypothetical protein [Nitrospira sp.]
MANYVGTYWPVGDQSAEAFAQTFYMELLGQKTIGAALLAGRERVAPSSNPSIGPTTFITAATISR